jgi:hypothetical protein
VEALESDHIVTEGNFILTRCGQGAAVLVWKRPSSFGSELELIDEIELD